jgi:hypothetical protein
MDRKRSGLRARYNVDNVAQGAHFDRSAIHGQAADACRAATGSAAEWRSSLQNLYFVGIPNAFSFGPVMRFVFGDKHAAAIPHRAPSRRGEHALRAIAGQERRGTRTVGPIACSTGGAPPVDLKALSR